MVLWATILILQGASLVGSSPGIQGVPENITVMFLSSTSVRVSWSTSQVDQVEKYDVMYKPTDARVVAVVAGNSEAVTLKDLYANTQYQLVVTAVKSGKKLRSRPIVFRTLEPPKTSPQQDSAVTGGPLPPPPPPSAQQPETYVQIRGVEIGIVLLVLMVWVGAIALFFNRWGKIRMLLPYQPDYKSEQLKVPGAGVCPPANAAYTHSSSQHVCSQTQHESRAVRTLSAQFSSESTTRTTSRVTNQLARSRTQSSQGTALLHSEPSAYQQLHWSNHRVDSVDSGGGTTNWSKTTRPRVNSAIDVAGFLSQEFLRRHGSTSRLCRKVRSADNLPLASSSRQNSDPREDCSQEEGDRDAFLRSNQDDSDKSDDTDTRQNSLDNPRHDSLIDTIPIQHQSSREQLTQQTSTSSSSSGGAATVVIAGPSSVSSQPLSSGAARRFAGWRQAGFNARAENYVRCPTRQPASVEERCCRHSCELARAGGAYQQQYQQEQCWHARSCEHEQRRRRRRATEASIEPVQPQHFGLPILSVSEPSPPDEPERADDYL